MQTLGKTQDTFMYRSIGRPNSGNFVLEGIYSTIHALARALKIEVLGCSIHYGSHVKSTSYSIAVKTKHGQTKFVSSICALNVKSRAVSENDIPLSAAISPAPQETLLANFSQ